MHQAYFNTDDGETVALVFSCNGSRYNDQIERAKQGLLQFSRPYFVIRTPNGLSQQENDGGNVSLMELHKYY